MKPEQDNRDASGSAGIRTTLQTTTDRLCQYPILRPFTRIMDRIMDDRVTVYAAMASFFIILSTIPFAMILVSLVRFFLPDSLGILWKDMMQVIPTDIYIPATRVLNELLSANTTSLVSLSAIISLWSASKGILGLEQGFHTIFRAPYSGNYLIRRLRCTLYTLVFVLSLLAATVLLVFGSTITALLVANIHFLSHLEELLFGFRIVVALVIFLLAFTLGYKTLTGIRCTFIDVLPGVLFSAAGWMLFSWIFSLYIQTFSNYTYLYGSMGVLMLLMLWVYICMMILLLGAELNMLIKEWGEKKE